MSHVMACIDGSRSSAAVCDSACWAGAKLSAPLSFLHVLDQQQFPVKSNLTGNIGLGSREHLLDELAALDEQRNKLALEQGRVMLEAAVKRAQANGINEPHQLQRHGALADTLQELEQGIRLLVLGRHGSDSAADHVGSQLERIIRIMHRPILVVPDEFTAPKSAMLAFDGSPTIQKGVQILAASQLCRDLPIHLVMIGADTADAAAQINSAERQLQDAGFETVTAIRAGDVEQSLHAYQAANGIDLLIMGAYGHSRIRQFLVGSTTNHMIRTSTTPILLLR